ncbi:MAG: FAD:protein FMN transferase [Planctomycetaceae bacterium]|nr:FAD:protein FMN transferase [Planctomycetaceae bacterium]
MMQRRVSLILVGLWIAAFRAAAAPPTDDAAPSPLQRYEFLQIRMAVPVHIAVYAGDEPTANLATQAAYARIKQIDRLMSHYDPDSELSRVCRDAVPGEPIVVSQELMDVLTHAARVSQQSNGAFDVTVGPLMDLWRKSRRTKTLPEKPELEAARRRVGHDMITLDSDARTVTFAIADMQLDLGGIAKGYAADEALRVLREHGIERALIDAGGDVVAGEPPPGAAGWTIGVAPLEAPDGAPQRFLSLRNAAIATSGDASQYVEIGGIRYSHIMDPRTGAGLTTRSSVTIVAGDGITADALASAVSVMGPEEGLKLVRTIPGAEGFVATQDDSGRNAWESAGFGGLEIQPDTPSAR